MENESNRNWNIWNVSLGRWFRGTIPSKNSSKFQDPYTVIKMTKEEAEFAVSELHKRELAYEFQIREIEPTSSSVSSAGAPINDRVCGSCGNDRCSSTEKSCWLCGASLR